MISVCIPCYDMNGKNGEYLSIALESLRKQTFKNFEVVISDQSTNDNVENAIKNFSDLTINYIKNEENRGNASANFNVAIKKLIV